MAGEPVLAESHHHGRTLSFSWDPLLHPRDRKGQFALLLSRLKDQPRGTQASFGPVSVERLHGKYHVRVRGEKLGRWRHAHDAAAVAIEQYDKHNPEPSEPFDPLHGATETRRFTYVSPRAAERGIVVLADPGSAPPLSKGHLLVDAEWEFFEHGADVYRSPLNAPLNVNGYRNAARFFAPKWQWRQRQEQGVYPFQQRRLAV